MAGSRSPGSPSRHKAPHTAARAVWPPESPPEAFRDDRAVYALSAISALSEGVVMQRASGEIVSCNPAAERILGLTRDQMMGRTSADPGWRTIHEDGSPFPGEDHPSMVTLRTGAALRGVVMGVPVPDGRVRWISVNSIPLFGPDGRQPDVVTTFTDITERKELDDARRHDAERLRQLAEETQATQETIRRSEENLRSFFDTIEDFLFVGDESGRIVHVNRAAATRLGYSREELLRMALPEVHPEERREEAGRIVAAMLAGDVKYCPIPVAAKDGTLIPVETRVFRGRWDGRDALFGLSKDISELRASEEKFARIFRSNPCPMVLRSMPTGRILDINDAFVRVLGYGREEVVGGTSVGIHLFLEPGRVDVAMERVRGQGALRDFEAAVLAKDGTVRHGLFSAEIVPLQAEEVLLTVMKDVTALKLAEEDLRRLNEELESQVDALRRSNAELEAFSYSVSHDLRAPIRAIDGFTAKLDRGYGEVLDLEGRRLLSTVRTNARHMGHLIDDLLAFSRSGRTALKKAPVDMKALVEGILDIHRSSPDRGGREITVADLPPALGDPGLLREVWLNLISNAIKFSATRPHPVVEIGALPGRGAPEYYVRDNGVGFDPRFAGKLFGVFERLHPAPQFEGTGIGLALVRRIVERHGGRAWGEGAPDRGATFFFTLAPASGAERELESEVALATS